MCMAGAKDARTRRPTRPVMTKKQGIHALENNKDTDNQSELYFDQLEINSVGTAGSTGVERGSSVVECRTRNRESPGSNPLCFRFEVWAFSFTSRRLSRLSCINEYLAIDSGGNVSE